MKITTPPAFLRSWFELPDVRIFMLVALMYSFAELRIATHAVGSNLEPALAASLTWVLSCQPCLDSCSIWQVFCCKIVVPLQSLYDIHILWVYKKYWQ